MNKIYAFKYCDCIHESAYVTISLHRTKSGAYSAMRKTFTQGVESFFREAPQLGEMGIL